MALLYYALASPRLRPECRKSRFRRGSGKATASVGPVPEGVKRVRILPLPEGWSAGEDGPYVCGVLQCWTLPENAHVRCTRFDARFGGLEMASHACSGAGMNILEPEAEHLSQRELRNESGRVLRAVSEGGVLVLTNSGVPVGRIVPLDAPSSALMLARPARRQGGWSALDITLKTREQSLKKTLEDVRDDRL